MVDQETRSPHPADPPPERPGGLRQTGAWAGMIGSILFVAVYTLEGLLRPGYHSASMFLSALAMGPRGLIQIVNFVVYGLLLLLFSRAVAAEFRKSSLGPILLSLIAICFVLSGLFVMDPVTTPPKDLSWH